MIKRVFDTNILLSDYKSHKPSAETTSAEVEAWAKALIKDQRADSILYPVEVEFLCGVLDKHDRRLREGYLRSFRVIDEYRTLPQDWQEARRIATHPGYHPRSRDLGDCLILAIADRLHFDVISDDKGLIRQHGRTRHHRP